jgi:hypothetical protein
MVLKFVLWGLVVAFGLMWLSRRAGRPGARKPAVTRELSVGAGGTAPARFNLYMRRGPPGVESAPPERQSARTNAFYGP